MESFASIEVATPKDVLPTPVVRIDPEIDYRQVNYINANTIPGTPATDGVGAAYYGVSTPVNTQIDVVFMQKRNAFLDTRTTFLEVQVTVGLYNDAQQTTTAIACSNGAFNGYVRGSFWSFFSKYTVYANQNNPTDDITDIGLVARWAFMMSMNSETKRCMSTLWGFDEVATNGLAGARLFGSAPYSTSSVLISNASNEGQIFAAGCTDAAPNRTVYVQVFDCCIPLLGTLGTGYGGMYYLGTGATKLSLWTEDPINTFFVPASDVPAMALNSVSPGVNINTGGTARYCGLMKLSSVVITRVRWWGNVLSVSDKIMSQIRAELPDPNLYTARAVSWNVTSIQLPQGVQGMQQIPLNLRKYSVKYLHTTFAPNGVPGTTLSSTAGSANVNVGLKYAGLNPNLGANTVYYLNGRRYPDAGLDPSNYPEQTMAENLKAWEVWTNGGPRPSVDMANFKVADPNLLGNGNIAGSTARAPYFRARGWSHGIFNTAPAAPGLRSWIGTCTPPITGCAWAATNNTITMGSGYPAINLAGNRHVSSQDFWLGVNTEILPEKGYFSGTTLNSTGNYLQLNIETPTAIPYTINIISMFDGFLTWDFTTGDSQYKS